LPDRDTLQGATPAVFGQPQHERVPSSWTGSGQRSKCATCHQAGIKPDGLWAALEVRHQHVAQKLRGAHAAAQPRRLDG
jgi:hypothetical protein